MSYRAAVRPSKTVAGAVLSALLALAAVPGLARTGEAVREPELGPAAFQAVIDTRPAPIVEAGPLDPAMRADGYVEGDSRFVERGQSRTVPSKPTVKLPTSKS